MVATLLMITPSLRLLRLCKQNRALKLIFKLTDPTDMFPSRKSELATLKQQADKQLTCLMFRRSWNLAEYPKLDLSEGTRDSLKIEFYIPRPKYERFKQSPHCQGSVLWNKLN